MSDYIPCFDSNGFNSLCPVPADYVPGCLPRASRPGNWFPRAAERIPIVPRSQWAELAAKVSLRPFVKSVLNQGSVGSCATEATAQAIMIARAVAGLPHVLLNPWYVYRSTSMGGAMGGSSIDENLRFIQENGCAPEELHPRSKGWNAKPSTEAVEAAKLYRGVEVYDIASVDEMVSALLTGYAVVYGANGHAVTKVQHLDESKGLDINSWGTNWGDGGFGVWASYRAVNWAYGAWALRVVMQSGGSEPPVPKP